MNEKHNVQMDLENQKSALSKHEITCRNDLEEERRRSEKQCVDCKKTLDKKANTHKLLKKQLDTTKDRVTLCKEVHKRCENNNNLLNEQSTGLNLTLTNCTHGHEKLNLKMVALNSSLQAIRDMIKISNKQLSQCQDDLKGHEKTVTSNVQLSAEGKDLSNRLLETNLDLTKCLNWTNALLFNQTKNQQDSLQCQSQVHNLTNFINKNLTSTRVTNLKLDQCLSSLDYFETKASDIKLEKIVLKQEVEQLRDSRALMIKMWNETKTELKQAKELIKNLQRTVEQLTQDELSVRTSLKAMMDNSQG